MANPSVPAAAQAIEPIIPVRRERRISVQYREPAVAATEVQIIFESWKRGVPIIKIVRRLQSGRSSVQKQPMIYLDIYSVLFIMLDRGDISQRHSNPGELTVRDFGRFFSAWKAGGSLNDCLKAIQERPITQVHQFASQVFRSINDRYRRENKANPSEVSTGNKSRQISQTSLLQLAVRRKVDGREAIVIYVDDVPMRLREQLLRLPDGLKYAPGIETGEDFFKHLANAEETGKAEARSKKQEKPDPELALLDPDGNVEARAEDQKRIKALEKESRKKLSGSLTDIPFEPDNPSPSSSTPLPSMEDDDDLDNILGLSTTPAANPQELGLENLLDDDGLESND